MTDFVKVKFTATYKKVHIVPKSAISLYDNNGIYYIFVTNILLADIYTRYYDRNDCDIEQYRVSESEYNRICKELGIEDAM